MNKRKLLFVTLIALVLFTCLTINFTWDNHFNTNYAYASTHDELFFTILHTNDEHSAIVPLPMIDYHPAVDNPTRGGFARLATLVEQIRSDKSASNEPVLLTSGGDFTGSEGYGFTVYGWLTLIGHAPELNLMTMIGYDVVTLGNHEYDMGHFVLAQSLLDAGYPDVQKPVLMATNTQPPAGHPLSTPGLINRTHLQVLDNGLKVGIIGLKGQSAISLVFKQGPVSFINPTTAARAAVAELTQQGADIIVAVNHAGPTENIALARNVPELDIILGGHTHAAINPVYEGSAIIFQTASHLQSLGMLELAYNPDTQTVRLRNQETEQPYHIPIDNSIPLHAEVDQAIMGLTELLNDRVNILTGGRFQNIRDIAAYSDFSITGNADVGAFVTDAIRLLAEQKTGKRVDIVFQPTGVFSTRLIPGSMDYSSGQLTFSCLANLMMLGTGPGPDFTIPGHSLISFYLTGEDIRRVMEMAVFLPGVMGSDFNQIMSGVRYSFDPSRNSPPTFRTVVKAEVYTGAKQQADGDPGYESLDPARLYHVVAEDFTLGFIPMINQMFPGLRITPRDEAGNPHPNLFGSRIIDSNGYELKTWKALAYYPSLEPPDAEGKRWIPAYYQSVPVRRNSISAYGQFDLTLETPGTKWVGEEFEVSVINARGYNNSVLTPLNGNYAASIFVDGTLIASYPTMNFVSGEASFRLVFNKDPGTYTIRVDLRDLNTGPMIRSSKSIDVELDYCPAEVEIHPRTINLNSQGRWVTAYVKLPAGCDVTDIDMSSIRLHYEVHALNAARVEVEDGVLVVKFDNAALNSFIKPGNGNFSITGTINGITFKGSDEVHIIAPGKGKVK